MKGLYGGYIITATDEETGIEYEFKTKDGVGGSNIPVEVKKDDSWWKATYSEVTGKILITEVREIKKYKKPFTDITKISKEQAIEMIKHIQGYDNETDFYIHKKETLQEWIDKGFVIEE